MVTRIPETKVPMAESLEKLLPSCFYFSFFLFAWVVGVAKTDGFSRDITPTKIGLRREKLSHLHFYFHDSLGGPNPSAVIVAEAPTTNASKTLFGAVVMMDDPLTAGPELSSKTVGRARDIRVCIAKRSGLFDGTDLRFRPRQIQWGQFEHSGTQHYNVRGKRNADCGWKRAFPVRPWVCPGPHPQHKFQRAGCCCGV